MLIDTSDEKCATGRQNEFLSHPFLVVGTRMAAISSIKLDLEAKSQVYRFFISYAREDEKIAIAVYNALETAMGPSAKVFIDSGLRFGLSFQEEIKKKLDETDTLVVIDSAVLKPAFWLYGN